MSSVEAPEETPGEGAAAMRPFLPAVVGPQAARAIDQAVGSRLDRLAQGLLASPIRANREYGAELRRALASMRESARQWESRREGGPGFGEETPNLADVACDAQSALPPSIPPVSVGQVADRFGWSSQYVRRLCVAGVLSATKPGREWLIDMESVEDLAVRRQI